jgi:hypothetical protein|tara:strand:+ start:1641 stop:1862 length:222 start_codon:yes stop_codon:yes gene_type:complete
MIILIFASLLALFIPGGTILFILWFRSKSAEKQREALRKLKERQKNTITKMKKEQFRYICMRRRDKKDRKDEA